MNLLSRVNQRLRRDYFRWHYGTTARSILDTAPLARGAEPFTLLSMVHQRDVFPYLVALKSFARQANPRRVVIVCDPSIGDAERAIFMRHIPHVELRGAVEFVHPEIPRGGTWERIFAISHYVKEDYVVQMDADTTTTGAIPEVLAAIRDASGFAIGEVPGQQLMTLQGACENATPWIEDGSTHVISFAEVALPKVGLANNRMYVRGCSGFSGFPASVGMVDELVDFSARMRRHLGERWNQWGTEQVTSNYIVANSRNPFVLPYPKYGTPDTADNSTVFWHFIGPMRFINTKYATVTRGLVDSLRPSLA